MMRIIRSAIICALFVMFGTSQAQVNEDELGAWYMYFVNTTFGESQWGLQGDLQYRNWDMIGDLEQLLLRGGLTWSPKSANITLTAGYASIHTGVYGPEQTTSAEHRIYQEALFPSKIGDRIFLNHRLRYEQRFVEGQDFRTRYRYNLFLNIPLNKAEMEPKTIYLALYNELFINGQREIGNGRSVELFDRNRTYGAIGYHLKAGPRVQVGIMQQTTDNWQKTQVQISLHHKI
ncbi:DUF2490 domain-containing protein [Imperialibacter roseus]|uniref:DUF2490 domain-containing protein n=1 Tax=Imperialibacter roseus TaxID=1324217 RepID=A0ABZ0INS6_9BACT|nr:DUF2490 domain-containing protein [Imperialibacter roseus]WOK06692.1 DUF2490 domain-containing protein [Imperialibacter roseus]